MRWPRGMIERRLQGKTRGQALIYVSIMMFALLGLGALVVDGGRLWLNQRAMQNAVDAAALAGAQELPQTSADWDATSPKGKDKRLGARYVAWQYAMEQNKPDNASTTHVGWTVTFAPQTYAGTDACTSHPELDILVCQSYVANDSVRVIARKTFRPILGFGLDWADINITTSATAMVGSLESVCAFPIFQAQDTLMAAGAWKPDGSGNFVEYNVPTIMKTSSDGNLDGNFLALQADGSNSKKAWADAVGSPGGCTNTYESVTTNTGNFVGQFDKALEDRAALWNNPAQPGYCPDTFPTFDSVTNEAVFPSGHPLAGQPLTTDNCYRMVQFPMLEGNAADINGSKTVAIRGYLTFYISNWCGQSSDPPKGSGSDPQHCAPPAGTSLPELKYGELWGFYLKYEAVTDLPIQAYDGLGTKVILLIA